MKSRWGVLWAGWACLALLATSCAGTAPSAATFSPISTPLRGSTGGVGDGLPYVIGAFFSTTGPVSSLGQPEADTVTMVAEAINASGGILGPDQLRHPLLVKLYDDQSDAAKAVEVVQKLIDDKTPIIIGGTGSPQSLAVIESVTRARIPYISVASASQIVNPIEQRAWVFKTPQDPLPVAQVQMDWIKAHGLARIASLGVNNAFGADSMKALRSLAEQAGVQIVYEGKFDPGDADFGSQLAQIARSNAQAVFVHATTGEGAPLTVQYRSMGIQLPLVHNYGIGNRAFLDMAKDATNGVIFPSGKLLVAQQLPDSDPQKAVLLKYSLDFKSKYNVAPSTFGGHAWDAMLMARSAFEAVGPDPSAIRDYMETRVKNLVGITGVFNITPNDHTGIGKESLVLVEIKDGQWKYIPPGEYANAP